MILARMWKWEKVYELLQCVGLVPGLLSVRRKGARRIRTKYILRVVRRNGSQYQSERR
jgi:hypothetical protein